MCEYLQGFVTIFQVPVLAIVFVWVAVGLFRDVFPMIVGLTDACMLLSLSGHACSLSREYQVMLPLDLAPWLCPPVLCRCPSVLAPVRWWTW